MNAGRKSGGKKTGGRKKGVPNKVTQELREQIRNVIETNIERVQKDLDALEPKDRIKVLTELFKYVVPQLRAVDHTTGGEKITRTVIVELKDKEDEN